MLQTFSFSTGKARDTVGNNPEKGAAATALPEFCM